MPPAFLPALLVNNGNWDQLVAAAYQVFQQQLLQQDLLISGTRVHFDTTLATDGKEAGFWHLITRDDGNGNRVAEADRAVKLPWIRPLILNGGDPAVSNFRYLEGSGRVRRYLWLPQNEYVVIVEEAPKRLSFVTAFNVDLNWKRLDLMKKRIKALP